MFVKCSQKLSEDLHTKHSKKMMSEEPNETQAFGICQDT